jgi:hypothetical protein
VSILILMSDDHPAFVVADKIGTTAAQKKLLFDPGRLNGQIGAVVGRDLELEQTARIAYVLGVQERDVVMMNWRLAASGYSVNVPIREDSAASGSTHCRTSLRARRPSLSYQDELSICKAR